VQEAVAVKKIFAIPLAALLCSWRCGQSPFAQGSHNHIEVKPVETTACEIADAPAQFNNKLVRVRGHVQVNFEFSTIGDDGCPEAIWFTYGDGSGPAGLVATIDGTARPHVTNERGRRVASAKVTLVRDSNFDEFEKLLTTAAKLNVHQENMRFAQRVTATFIGRIDGVSRQDHIAHQHRYPNRKPGSEGFGQFGMFDAQLVVERVEGISISENVDMILHKVEDPITPPAIPIDLPDSNPSLLWQKNDAIQ